MFLVTRHQQRFNRFLDETADVSFLVRISGKQYCPTPMNLNEKWLFSLATETSHKNGLALSDVSRITGETIEIARGTTNYEKRKSTPKYSKTYSNPVIWFDVLFWVHTRKKQWRCCGPHMLSYMHTYFLELWSKTTIIPDQKWNSFGERLGEGTPWTGKFPAVARWWTLQFREQVTTSHTVCCAPEVTFYLARIQHANSKPLQVYTCMNQHRDIDTPGTIYRWPSGHTSAYPESLH